MKRGQWRHYHDCTNWMPRVWHLSKEARVSSPSLVCAPNGPRILVGTVKTTVGSCTARSTHHVGNDSGSWIASYLLQQGLDHGAQCQCRRLTHIPSHTHTVTHTHTHTHTHINRRPHRRKHRPYCETLSTVSPHLSHWGVGKPAHWGSVWKFPVSPHVSENFPKKIKVLKCETGKIPELLEKKPLFTGQNLIFTTI